MQGRQGAVQKQPWMDSSHPSLRMSKSLTDCEHDRVGQLHVADADTGDEADQPWHHIRVVHINGLGDGLETIQ